MKDLETVLNQALNKVFAPNIWNRKIKVRLELIDGVTVVIDEQIRYYFTARYLDNPRILCEECVKTYALHKAQGILKKIPLLEEVR